MAMMPRSASTANDGGVSVLRMETGSELRMIADGSGFTTIEEFRSGVA
jgi:hypothetical protein